MKSWVEKECSWNSDGVLAQGSCGRSQGVLNRPRPDLVQTQSQSLDLTQTQIPDRTQSLRTQKRPRKGRFGL